MLQIYRDLAGEANQLARKYSEIHTTVQSNETHTYLPEFWTAMVPFKAEFYKSLAHFNAAKSAGDGLSKVDGYPPERPPLTDDVIRRQHLKEAIVSLEEARRIQRMSRDLKTKDMLTKVVRGMLEKAEVELEALDQIISESDYDKDDLELITITIEGIAGLLLL